MTSPWVVGDDTADKKALNDEEVMHAIADLLQSRGVSVRQGNFLFTQMLVISALALHATPRRFDELLEIMRQHYKVMYDKHFGGKEKGDKE